jgi:hypothetical protein
MAYMMSCNPDETLKYTLASIFIEYLLGPDIHGDLASLVEPQEAETWLISNLNLNISQKNSGTEWEYFP